VNAIAVSNQGSYLATTSDDGSLFLWDLEGNHLHSFPAKGHINALQFDPSERYLVGAYTDCHAYVWSTVDGSLHHSLPHKEQVNCITISFDGEYVVTGSSDHTVGVWETDSGRQTASLKHSGEVTALTLSPDNKYLAVGCNDGTVKIWLYRPEQLVREAMSRVAHILTKEEWSKYAGNEPYEIISNLLY
jgi:WD40 repeat protein